MTGYEHRRGPGLKARLAVWSLTLALIAVAGLARGRSMDSQGSPVPAELVGQWQTAIASPSGIRDYARGDIPGAPDVSQAQSGAVRLAFYFREDGSYDLAWVWHATHGNACGRWISWDERGTLSIDGPSWTFQPSSATSRTLDSCSLQLTTKPVNAGKDTVTVSPAIDEHGNQQLRLRYASGNTLVLEKLTRS